MSETMHAFQAMSIKFFEDNKDLYDYILHEIPAEGVDGWSAYSMISANRSLQNYINTAGETTVGLPNTYLRYFKHAVRLLLEYTENHPLVADDMYPYIAIVCPGSVPVKTDHRIGNPAIIDFNGRWHTLGKDMSHVAFTTENSKNMHSIIRLDVWKEVPGSIDDKFIFHPPNLG